MQKMLFLFIGLAALLLSACQTNSPRRVDCISDNPVAAAQKFYDLYIAQRTGGVPYGPHLATLRPYLRVGLYQALQQAKAQQLDDIAQHPGDKPAFVDGDLFSNVAEGPTTTKVLSDGSKTTLPVELTYLHPGEKPYHWQDSVKMVQEHSCWVVDDIAYEANWDVAAHETLRWTLSNPQ